MKLKIFRIVDLCLTLKEEKGIEVKFEWCPNANNFWVAAWEGFKFIEQEDQEWEMYESVYLDWENAEEKLDAIILKLESL